MDTNERIKELETQVHELEKDLIHDALTGLKTRAFLEEELGIYLNAIAYNKEGKRKNWFGFKNLSLVFFDIDHFKKVNDSYGHDMGDLVLKKVAETIQSNLRTGDTAARWGGEEIVVTLLGASREDALVKAEKIRGDVENLSFINNADLKVTISSGLACVEDDLALPELIKRADEALYKAKESGRNQVKVYGRD